MTTLPTVFTLGYEGRAPHDFVATLREHGVRQLIDVREVARSRKPGFAKTALSDGLETAGIAYVHLRAAGTPADIRADYKTGGGVRAFRAAYRAHVRSDPNIVAQLAELAMRAPSALMCVEHDAAACHRFVLGEELEARGFRVVHL